MHDGSLGCGKDLYQTEMERGFQKTQTMLKYREPPVARPGMRRICVRNVALTKGNTILM